MQINIAAIYQKYELIKMIDLHWIIQLGITNTLIIIN